ncbi:MAG: Ig-like domain-containing protein, partial [Bacteroidota bacterium]
SVLFQGNFRVNENSLEDQRTEWSEVQDFRVQFVADDVLCNSRGIELYVAHPMGGFVGNNNIQNVADCETYTIGWSYRNFGQTNDVLFPNEFRPMILPDSLKVFIPEGWEYVPETFEILSLPQDECLIANQNSFIPATIPVVTELPNGIELVWSNDGTWPLPDDGCIYLSLQYNFQMQIRPTCGAEEGADNFMPATLFYQDWYYAEEAFQAPQSITYELFKPENHWTSVPFSILPLQGNDLTSTNEVNWSIRVINESGQHNLSGVWVALEIPNEDSFEVNEIAYLEGGEQITPVESQGYFVFLVEEVPAGGFIDILLNGTVTSCDLDNLQVLGGKDCSFDLLTLDLADQACILEETSLSYSLEDTELQVNFISPQESTGLCEEQVYQVILNNALQGYVSGLQLTAAFSEGLSIDEQGSFIQYPGPPELTSEPGEELYDQLSNPQIVDTGEGFEYSWDISEILADLLPDAGLPGAQSPDSNAVLIELSFLTNCGFEFGNAVQLRIDGVRACGEALPSIISAPMEIAIDEPAPTLESFTSIEIIGEAGCDSLVNAEVFILFQGGTSSFLEDSLQTIQTVLPDGIQYIPGSVLQLAGAESFNPEPEVQLINGSQSLEWMVPSQVTAGDSLWFSVQLETDGLEPGTYEGNFTNQEITALTCGTDTCFLEMEVESFNWQIEVESCLNPPIAVPDTFFLNMNEVVNLSVLENDIEANESLILGSFDIITNPNNAVIFEMQPGTFEYTPSNSWTGQDSLQYLICNEVGCDTTWVQITVFDPVSECNT